MSVVILLLSPLKCTSIFKRIGILSSLHNKIFCALIRAHIQYFNIYASYGYYDVKYYSLKMFINTNIDFRNILKSRTSYQYILMHRYTLNCEWDSIQFYGVDLLFFFFCVFISLNWCPSPIKYLLKFIWI